MKRSWIFLIVVASLVSWPARPRAHDIPADVLVNMFVKPDGNRLLLVVRVPLGSMRDMNLPLHGGAFLDFPVPDATLRDAVRVWIAQEMTWYENDRPLPVATVQAMQVSLP